LRGSVRRNEGVLVLVLLASAAASAANAQDAGGGGRRFDVRLTARATYDSNVARGNQTVATVRDVRPGDYIYEPRATIDLVLPMARQAVFLTGNVGYEFHQYNKDLAREFIDLNGGARTTAGPCGVQLTGGISRRQSNLEDLALTVTRNTEQVLSAGASLQCATPLGIGTTVGYQYSTQSNSADDVPGADTNGVSMGLVYSNRAIGKLALTGSYSKTDYSADDELLNPQSGYEQYQGTLSLRREIGHRLAGQASIGYSSQKTEGRAESFHGVTGSGALTYRLNPRLDLGLNYNRNIDTSLDPNIDYVIDELFGISATYRLSSRVSASLGADVNKRNFRGEVTPSPTTISNDELKSVKGALTFKVGRRSSLALNGQYEDRNATPTIFSYTGYRVGIAISTDF